MTKFVKVLCLVWLLALLGACQSFDLSWLSGATEVAKVAADARSEYQDRKASRIAANASSASSLSSSSGSSYSALSCAINSTGTVSGKAVACLKNSCGRTITAHYAGGSIAVADGVCMRNPGTSQMAGCERGNGFDWSNRKCVR